MKSPELSILEQMAQTIQENIKNCVEDNKKVVERAMAQIATQQFEKEKELGVETK